MKKEQIINIFYETLSTDNNVMIHGFVEAADEIIALQDKPEPKPTGLQGLSISDLYCLWEGITDNKPFSNKIATELNSRIDKLIENEGL